MGRTHGRSRRRAASHALSPPLLSTGVGCPYDLLGHMGHTDGRTSNRSSVTRATMCSDPHVAYARASIGSQARSCLRLASRMARRVPPVSSASGSKGRAKAAYAAVVTAALKRPRITAAQATRRSMELSVKSPALSGSAFSSECAPRHLQPTPPDAPELSEPPLAAADAGDCRQQAAFRQA